ncbi:MAG TPA: TonB-dependent receptor plug domain-containing protein [Opitutaceae bacterium]|nr:TonB-dependent receptor plug domain-containing protein [Opitutaceae bacterium]
MKNWIKSGSSVAALGVLLIAATGGAWAQQTAPTSATTPTDANAPAASPNFTPMTTSAGGEEEQVVKLSPFEVTAAPENSYTAATTLAGNRLNTQIRDIGNAVSVVTAQFLKDIGATDNSTLLQYTTNTEVGNVYGNFAGTGDSSFLDESNHFTQPNTNTRIRGLTAADNTREYFETDLPWDAYDVDGVDLQRGPNSILFGQGSPAGIINTRLKQASFKNSGEVQARAGSFGTNRVSLDVNRVLIPNQLAIRLDLLRNDNKYKEKPAYDLDKRIYGAIRWEPAILAKGSARSIFKGDIEFGDVNSNTPRELPPLDLITPWFYSGTYQGVNVAGANFTYNNLNRISLTPAQNEDDNTGLPGHGTNRPSHNGPSEISGTPNQYYQPWVGNMGSQFGNPMWVFNGDGSGAGAFGASAIDWEPTAFHAMNSSGVVNADNSSIMQFQRPAGVAPYRTFATNAKLPFSTFGVYKDKSLTDPSVFDFYNNQLDGPTKWEWQNFRTYNLSWDQTFFDDHFGWEATYNNEWYKNGHVSLLTGEQQGIGIDYNSQLTTGNPAGGYENGTANPNFGRPYIGDNGTYGNGNYLSNREGSRLTAFADYDFSEHHKNMLTRFLGRHTITGLLDKESQFTDTRSWQRYGIDNAWEYRENGSPTDSPALTFTNNYTAPYTMIYLGPSLASDSAAAGANIPRPTSNVAIPTGAQNVYTFDATWNKPTNPSDPNYVNPGAFFYNAYYPMNDPITGLPQTTGNSTQNTNFANYVGFHNVPVNIIDSQASQANQDLLTHDARLTKSTLFSRAADWQAHLWDNAIVGTFGVREDIAKSWTYSESTASSTTDAYGHLNLTPAVYHLNTDPDNRLSVRSKAWTTVAHLNQFPYMKWLPIQVSLYYNHSTDFQPAAQRVDVYGLPLSAPEGETKDYGILLESSNGRYSLKINKYTTTSTNATSSALNGAWFIGTSQAWAANWLNRFQYNWTTDTIAGAVAVNDPTNTEYNYEPAPGETLAQAQAREASVISAWRAWQASVDPRFYSAWQINLNDNTKSVTATVPNGFAVTEDSKSEGYELEFSASPTTNWRITMNASRSTAQRSNIGGTNLRAFINAYQAALNTPGKGYSGVVGGVGDLRIWWGGAGNETSLQDWNNNIGAEWSQRALQEGTDVPELRKYHYNAITNYTFDRWLLKGVNVGGGVRYESGVVIGYRPVAGATATEISFDIANPYMGPSETDFDLWVGYSRKIWKGITWNIQLNVRNVGVGNELIPITTEPDGSPATYRIRPPQTWELTNTFDF